MTEATQMLVRDKVERMNNPISGWTLLSVEDIGEAQAKGELLNSVALSCQAVLRCLEEGKEVKHLLVHLADLQELVDRFDLESERLVSRSLSALRKKYGTYENLRLASLEPTVELVEEEGTDKEE